MFEMVKQFLFRQKAAFQTERYAIKKFFHSLLNLATKQLLLSINEGYESVMNSGVVSGHHYLVYDLPDDFLQNGGRMEQEDQPSPKSRFVYFNEVIRNGFFSS